FSRSKRPATFLWVFRCRPMTFLSPHDFFVSMAWNWHDVALDWICWALVAIGVWGVRPRCGRRRGVARRPERTGQHPRPGTLHFIRLGARDPARRRAAALAIRHRRH